ncbi:MAG: hypothetical protein H7123_08465, partial [Thermoleophilia bacterium]|nr:hypothetical protein [Thermoleophilia bacterium]
MHTYFDDYGTLDLILGTGRTLNRIPDGPQPKVVTPAPRAQTPAEKKAAADATAADDAKAKVLADQAQARKKQQADATAAALKAKDDAATKAKAGVDALHT